MQDNFDVVVVGAGAAGIAAVRRLAGTGLSVVALEARGRIGGRAHSVLAAPGVPVDCGCGWLHSADLNPLVDLVASAGFTIDKTPPHWTKQAGNQDFSPEDQRAFGEAYASFEQKLADAAKTGVDRPAAELFAPRGRWNHLLDAVSSYYSGAEYDRVSVLDYDAYEDSGVNYRVAEGYGTAIAALADRTRIVTSCDVTRIRHDGPSVQVETSRGTLSARAVIVTLPTPLIRDGLFSPGLPEKVAAAAGLELGLADKAFLLMDEPEALPADGHLFGRIDRTETGSYHTRPFGRPYIEVFLGGRTADHLEGEGPGAMAAFAIEELTGLMGSDFRRTLTPAGETAWRSDPWARGAYSHALPGHAGDRAILAAPVGGRIFFAGEATHASQYSTAHGAWETGLRAADEALAALT